jgi:chromosome partitioning protein
MVHGSGTTWGTELGNLSELRKATGTLDSRPAGEVARLSPILVSAIRRNMSSPGGPGAYPGPTQVPPRSQPELFGCSGTPEGVADRIRWIPQGRCATFLSGCPALAAPRDASRPMSTTVPAQAHTIAVLSQKGGTGKTTLVRSLTDVLRRLGMDVLPIDLDPQGNLSEYFGVDQGAFPTIRELLVGQARTADAIHKDMIPANLSLAEAELGLSGKIGRELALKRALSEARRKHEFILIDCPPALGLLTVNALVAASHALISAEAEYFSFRGVEQALEVTKLTREWLNEDLRCLGVVVNIADLRTIHARETSSRLKERYGSKVFETIIHRSIRYAESAQQGLSILDYRPELSGDYVRLTHELLARLREEEARVPAGAVSGELAA